jgi:hypothetical protein
MSKLASILSTFHSLLPCICSSLLPYSCTNKIVTSWWRTYGCRNGYVRSTNGNNVRQH